MIRLALRDLRHDGLHLVFSVISMAVLVFAFLLLIPLSLAMTGVAEGGGLPQNLILVERGVLQPEMSRIDAGLASQVAAILEDRVSRVDPIVFRILRVEDHPLQLRGVDPGAWATTFRLRLTEGRWPSGPSEIVLGLLAAQAGGWEIGSEIGIYGRPFRVAGIVEGPGTKTQTVWMSYAAARSLFGETKDPQLLVVQLQPSADALTAQRDLEQGLGGGGRTYDAYLEDALLQEYGSALNDLRALSTLTTVVAIVAVVLGSHNLAWLAAEERSRSLGILRGIGFGRRTVGGYLLLRGGVVSVASYALALAGAWLFLAIESGVGELNIAGAQVSLDLNPATAVLGLVLVWAAGLAGTWLSARRTLNAPPASLLGRGPGGSFA